MKKNIINKRVFAAMLLLTLLTDFLLLTIISLGGGNWSEPIVSFIIINMTGALLVLWGIGWWNPESLVYFIREKFIREKIKK